MRQWKGLVTLVAISITPAAAIQHIAVQQEDSESVLHAPLCCECEKIT